MSAHFNTIERILLQLDQKYLDQVETYLEYLMFLQQKEAEPINSISEANEHPSLENKSLQLFRQFKGDAPYPDLNISKYDVYEQ
jgi:hypothetical protein